ncbi:Uncharacterized protein dnm_096130 [Desulfonema magnum]|uniref:Uncharacterized protein n=1 Tax=Desulfonema magnum TaxID=45655 RepID=A0A975BXV3_9BACT|nr:Uncharacterized protein dnm_096130 [Desulfonema magnum]
MKTRGFLSENIFITEGEKPGFFMSVYSEFPYNQQIEKFPDCARDSKETRLFFRDEARSPAGKSRVSPHMHQAKITTYCFY